ncbi:MAG: helicase associated domain-containing protein, partial [Proteobacteria bacterium]|nr:helicase associated domain-containing protein [Pseudomonadota bacterium]
INALKAHDDALSEELDQYRTQLGKNSKSIISSFTSDKIIFDLPKTIDQTFVNNLKTILVEQTTESWMFWYGLLSNYVEDRGNCLISERFEIDGYKLGSWVSVQRTKKDSMSQERRDRLDQLGFVWNPYDAKWGKSYSHLKDFVEEHDHCLVPVEYEIDGYKLGNWVSVQRTYKDEMSQERRDRLDQLGFIWDVLDAQWEEGYSHLKDYVEEHKDCLVSDRYEIDGHKFGQWVRKQRTNKDKMSQDRRERLEALAGWVWSA